MLYLDSLKFEPVANIIDKYINDKEQDEYNSRHNIE